LTTERPDHDFRLLITSPPLSSRQQSLWSLSLRLLSPEPVYDLTKLSSDLLKATFDIAAARAKAAEIAARLNRLGGAASTARPSPSGATPLTTSMQPPTDMAAKLAALRAKFGAKPLLNAPGANNASTVSRRSLSRRASTTRPRPACLPESSSYILFGILLFPSLPSPFGKQPKGTLQPSASSVASGGGLAMSIHPSLLEQPTQDGPSALAASKDRTKPMQPKFTSLKVRSPRYHP
jgi:hypothetical protein